MIRTCDRCQVTDIARTRSCQLYRLESCNYILNIPLSIESLFGLRIPVQSSRPRLSETKNSVGFFSVRNETTKNNVTAYIHISNPTLCNCKKQGDEFRVYTHFSDNLLLRSSVTGSPICDTLSGLAFSDNLHTNDHSINPLLESLPNFQELGFHFCRLDICSRLFLWNQHPCDAWWNLVAL